MRMLTALSLGIAALVFPWIAAAKAPKTQTLPAPTVRPAIDGVMAVFQTYPVVALGDEHGLAQEEDFFAALVRDPRFARDVGNVVVEFGDAAQQETIDRYVNGEDVPYPQLRRVWADNVGWLPTITAIGYMDFYAQVRAVNATLPAGQRIHIWLGDPPIDWSKIKSRDDFAPIFMLRNSYPAAIINDQILSKKQKALVIYGWGHFSRQPDKDGRRSLGLLVDDAHSHSFFRVFPYTGFNEKKCSAAFEQAIRTWPTLALVTPVRNTTLEHQLIRQECSHLLPGSVGFAPGTTEEQKTEILRTTEENQAGINGDALLYLGPAASLTRSPINPDIYLDVEYHKEIERQLQIKAPFFKMYGFEPQPIAPHYLRP